MFPYYALCSVISLAYLWESNIPTPILPATFGLSQLLSPCAASKIQLTHPGISLLSRFSTSCPLIFVLESLQRLPFVLMHGCKYSKVDQESTPVNVNLEVSLESDHY